MHNEFYPKQHQKSNNECPTCGFEIASSQAFEQVLSGQFDNHKNGDFVATRGTPVRVSNMMSDVAVPAAQSLIWATVVMLPAVSISMAMRWEWSAPLFVGASTVLVSWISAMARSEKSLVKIEEFSYSASEISSKKVAASHNEKPFKMEVLHNYNGIKSTLQLLELPDTITNEMLGEYLRDILAGKSLARRNWTGQGKEFSRDSYDILTDKLLQAKIIISSANGKKILSNGGKHAVKALVREGLI